jgi:hypothetical protein
MLIPVYAPYMRRILASSNNRGRVFTWPQVRPFWQRELTDLDEHVFVCHADDHVFPLQLGAEFRLVGLG